MIFDIALRTETKAIYKAQIINSLSLSLRTLFKDKDYKGELKEISINCICAEVPVGYEHLFKMKKPKYVDYKMTVNKFTGEPFELNKILLFDIKFNEEEYFNYINSPDEESKKIFINLLLDSVENLELPKKIKDFDKKKFIADLHIALSLL